MKQPIYITSACSISAQHTYDPGRYVQQSYYGDPDGSDWNGKPWRFNPVQGGDWHGLPSTVLEFKSDSPTTLYAKIKPRHWATGKLLEDVVMEQWISLEGPLAQVKFKMTCTGTITITAYADFSILRQVCI